MPRSLVCLFAILLLHFDHACSQNLRQYTPGIFTDTIPQDIHAAMKQRLARDKSRVALTGKAGKYVEDLYEERFEYVVRTFNEDLLFAEHPLTDFLRRVNARIHQANPQLSGDVSVFAFASGTVNAVSFGEGTIGIMLGLLQRLETEDQVAFVLCHELAHYYADHAGNSFRELATINTDSKIKEQVRSIRNSPYNRYTRLKQLFESLDLSLTRHNRKSEYEADSLGLQYYLKAGYDPAAPLEVMQILDKADRGFFTDTLDLRKIFASASFHFREEWLHAPPRQMTYKPMRDNDADTLRTHPDCMKRLRRLTALIGTDTIRHGVRSVSGYRDLASFEIVNTHYHFRQYGKALFEAMMLAKRFPDHPYPHAMVAKSMYQLYKAQKDHNLEKVLELPDPRFEPNYNELLNFLNNLRLHELARLGYEYVTNSPEVCYSNEEFIHALWLFSRFDFSKVSEEKVALEYQSIFPSGKYVAEMNPD